MQVWQHSPNFQVTDNTRLSEINKESKFEKCSATVTSANTGVDDITISFPVSVNQISGIYKFQLPALSADQMVVSANLDFTVMVPAVSAS